MHQGGCLQGVLTALPLQVVRRQTPQFRVEQHDHLGHCFVVADIESTRESGYISWRIHNSLVGDDGNHRGENGHRASRSLELGKYRKKIKGREDRSSRPFQLTPKDRDLYGRKYISSRMQKKRGF